MRCRFCQSRLRKNERALCEICAFNLPISLVAKLRRDEAEPKKEIPASESPMGWRNAVLDAALNAPAKGHA